jgi:hypothetical protein
MLQLEYGKRYRSRSGQVTGPLFKTPVPGIFLAFAGYFVGEKGWRTWAEDGSTVTGCIGLDRDLVEALPE